MVVDTVSSPVELQVDLSNPKQIMDLLVAYKIHFRDRRFANRLFLYEDWIKLVEAGRLFPEDTYTREERALLSEPIDVVYDCYPANLDRMTICRGGLHGGYTLTY